MIKENVPGATNIMYDTRIGLLRVLAAIMVITLHVLGHGGAIDESILSISSTKYYFAWGLEALAYPAVNIFVLITGYVYYQNKWKWKRIVSLWAEAVFYSVLFEVIFQIGKQSVNVHELICAFIPVLKNRWWFLTVYFCLFFFIPYINKLLLSISKREHLILIITLITFFCVIANIGRLAGSDIYNTSNGYSIVWLTILYIVGAYIRREEKIAHYSCWLYWAGYLFVAFAMWIVKIYMPLYDYLFWKYSSLFTLLMSVLMVAAFLSMRRMENSKLLNVIRIVSASSFGCYLISDHPHVRENLIAGCMSKLIYLSTGRYFAFLLCIIFGVWGACVIVDVLRSAILARTYTNINDCFRKYR